jgi:DHA1 family bicyclomycin/chloramphenicol resistance-like MFS transporter
VPLSPRSARFTAILGSLAALPPLSVDISLPTLPAVGLAFGAPPGEVQATLSAFLLGFAAGQLIHGPASDRFGRRPVLLAGVGLYVLAGVACAVAPSLGVLVAMRLTQGLGACAGIVVARAVIRDSFEGDQMVRRQTILSSISTVAMLSAPLIGGLLLTISGFRAVYAVLPATGAAMLALCALGLPETAPPGRARQRRGYLRVLSEPGAVAPALVNALAFAGMFACISISPHLLLGQFGVSPRGFGLVFAAIALSSLAGSSLHRLLLGRLSSRALGALGLGVLGLAVLGLAAATLAPHMGLVVAAMASYAFACGSVMPSSVAAAMMPLPELAGTTAAVIGCSQFVAGAAAAALVARAPSVSGLAIVVASFAVPALVVAIIARGGLRARGRRCTDSLARSAAR